MVTRVFTQTQIFMSTLLAQAQAFVTALVGFPVALLTYLRELMHFRRLANRFPGPRTLPLIGNIFDNGFRLPDGKLIRYLLEVVTEYRTGQIWIGPVRLLFINDPKDIQTFMQNQNNLSKPRFFYRFVADILGNGLISENGKEWQRFHKIIAPTFHQEKLNSYMSVFNKQSDILTKLLCERASGETFDVRHMLSRYTFDVIMGTILGTSSKEQIQESGVIPIIEKGLEAVGLRITCPWLTSDMIFHFSSWKKELTQAQAALRTLIQRVIQQRVQSTELAIERSAWSESQDGTRPRHDLLESLLLQKGKGTHITEEEIEAQVRTNLLAGFDTVYLTIGLALYMLAKYPEVQRKVVMELEEIFAGKRNVEISTDMLRDMVYLEAVIKETLRMHGPVWFVCRQAGEDTPLQTSDLVIPAGAFVGISAKSVHMDPEVYPNSEVFDPDRFLPENSANRHPYAFLPFSAGQRACIGKKFAMVELKVALSKILWNCEVLPDPTYEPVFTFGISFAPINGIWLKFLKRW